MARDVNMFLLEYSTHIQLWLLGSTNTELKDKGTSQ